MGNRGMDATKLEAAESFWLDIGGPLVLLLVTFLIRAVHAGQPIVENYVGRQVPTAMVARNLDRGSGLLRPQLDTAPFPNYFLVEPPIYESGVVVLKRATGLSLEEAGRILSALATALAAWGLFALARRREGRLRGATWPWPPSPSFPSRSAMGAPFSPTPRCWAPSWLGLACWDRYRSRPRWYWLAAGWFLVALGFALKITAAFLLVPLVLVIARAPIAASDPRGLLDAAAGPVVVCMGRPSARMRGQVRARRPITGRSGSGSSGRPRS